MKEECGVFGVIGCKDASRLCYLGLYALQHRGQESAGIVSMDGKQVYVLKDMGLVSEVFNHENLHYLKGDSAIGHVRYSTTGSSHFANIQPLFSKTSKGKLAIAHNGNLTNAVMLYQDLKEEGAIFQSTVDSEVILHLVARSKIKSIVENFQQSLKMIEGAYSLVVLGEGYLLAARDPHGFRPLVLGQHVEGGYVVASETCALDLIGARFIREIAPGEIVYIDSELNVHSYSTLIGSKHAHCIFEYVYFSRPDSIVFGKTVHVVRKAFGRILAQEHPIEADIVMSIPDSGNSAALGYSEESGIPFEFGMTRNHYVGRTFIQPTQKIRDFGVRVKLNAIKEVLKGKRVVVVDDSIVRGTTSKRRVAALRDAGAKEVHLRISSPPVTYPCHFGIDTPKREHLIAAKKQLNDIRRYVGADTLGFLSLEGMRKAASKNGVNQFCTACFTGKYPLKIRNKGKYSIEKQRIHYYAQTNRH
ncbi:amidophosphoribosyltransferase [Thermoproteota archaeon]